MVKFVHISMCTCACLYAYVWLQVCAYLQNYSRAIKICILVNLCNNMFLNHLGNFFTMYLEMYVQKVLHSLFSLHELLSCFKVSDIGEQITKKTSEGRKAYFKARISKTAFIIRWLHFHYSVQSFKIFIEK